MRPHWIRMGHKPSDGCSYKRRRHRHIGKKKLMCVRERETHKDKDHVKTEAEQSYTAASQGVSGAIRNQKQLQSYSQSLRKEHTSADILIWNFQLPQLGKTKFLLFQAIQSVVLCYRNQYNRYVYLGELVNFPKPYFVYL